MTEKRIYPATEMNNGITLYNALKPCGRILNLKAEGWTVWDCSPIYGADGRVHVFATRWPDNDRPDRTWYLGGSQMVHAIAPKPEGPYTVADIVVACDGGDSRWDAAGVINTKIYRVDGRYVLIYTGCASRRNDGSVMLPENQAAKETQAIGMLTAESLDGPWMRVSDVAPLIASAPDRSGPDGIACNNPALLQHPNGQFWMYYKGIQYPPGTTFTPGMEEGGGWCKPTATICLAVADRLEGPYRKQPANPVIGLDMIMQHGKVEDPYVWHDGRWFWLISNRVGTAPGPGGLLYRSSDGLRWEPPVPGYPSPADLWGRRQRLEEPNLLWRDGTPTHLFNVIGPCDEDPGYSGFVFAIESDKE